ncbi:MAG: GFA family protein [Pseudogulbenkiania sp.]|nr:GFA family protein [Pseudogulbenkiania sp.]
MRYQVVGELGALVFCHCSRCRKANGSAFAAVVPVQRADFHLLSGDELLAGYESSSGVRRVFCRQCASPLYSERDSRPELLRLRVGTLDTPLAGPVGAHIFTGSKAEWFDIHDDAPQYAERPWGEAMTQAKLCLAAAQSASVCGDIAANVSDHLRYVRTAADAGADIVVFPELSLCGYELALLAECILAPQDARLEPLRDAAREYRLTIVAGAPLDSGTARPHIGAIVFLPDGSTTLHSKQYLHDGEQAYASAGPGGPLLAVAGEPLALAICADTAYAAHPQAAATAGAALYAAGVLVSEAGYPADAALLQRYAAEHGFGVLMANHAAPTGGWTPAGCSAFWAPGGELVAAAPGAGEWLVLARREADGWHGELHAPAT